MNRGHKKPTAGLTLKAQLAVLAGGVTLSLSPSTLAALNSATDPSAQLAVLRQAARSGELIPVQSPDAGKSLRSAQWGNADWKKFRNTGTPG
jgi:hypothetical protein